MPIHIYLQYLTQHGIVIIMIMNVEQFLFTEIVWIYVSIVFTVAYRVGPPGMAWKTIESPSPWEFPRKWQLHNAFYTWCEIQVKYDLDVLHTRLNVIREVSQLLEKYPFCVDEHEISQFSIHVVLTYMDTVPVILTGSKGHSISVHLCTSPGQWKTR